MIIIEILTTQ